MIFGKLVIQKLDLFAQSPYVVFGLEGDFPTAEDKHRPRPKLTIDIEQWERLGKPVEVSLEVLAGADAAIEVH